MLDISLDLTKYIMLWGSAFLGGFLVTFLLTFMLHKKISWGGIILSFFIGLILLIMAMYGLFNGFLK